MLFVFTGCAARLDILDYQKDVFMSENPVLLLTNAIVLTMDAALTQYEPGAVAVQGDSIAAVGLEADLRAQFPEAQVIDCAGKVLMPGLVNAHSHAAMTLLRGLADDLRLDVWLLGYMMPVEREFVSPISCAWAPSWPAPR